MLLPCNCWPGNCMKLNCCLGKCWSHLIDLDIGYLHLWFCLKCHLLILTLVIYICGSVWNVTYWYWHWLFTFVFLFEMSLLDLDIGYLHLWFCLKCHFNELSYIHFYLNFIFNWTFIRLSNNEWLLGIRKPQYIVRSLYP